MIAPIIWADLSASSSLSENVLERKSFAVFSAGKASFRSSNWEPFWMSQFTNTISWRHLELRLVLAMCLLVGSLIRVVGQRFHSLTHMVKLQVSLSMRSGLSYREQSEECVLLVKSVSAAKHSSTLRLELFSDERHRQHVHWILQIPRIPFLVFS